MFLIYNIYDMIVFCSQLDRAKVNLNAFGLFDSG